MKIAILGTSNSLLMNGYSAIYKAIEYPHQVDNFSVGGAYNLYGLLANEVYNISKNYDVVILDFVINDNGYLHSGLDKNDVESDLLTLFSTFKRSNCKIICLIFCRSVWDNTAYARNLHLTICNQLNISFLDVFSCLSGIKDKVEPVYKDPSHISHIYSKYIAIALKAKRIEITSFAYKLRNFIIDYGIKRKISKNNFFVVTAEEMFKNNSHCKIKVLGTSFVTHKTIENNSIDGIDLLIKDSYLIGMLGYLDKRTGWINFSEKEKYNKLLSVSWPSGFYFRHFKPYIYIYDTIKMSEGKRNDALLCKDEPFTYEFKYSYNRNKIAYLLFSKQKIKKQEINVQQFDVTPDRNYLISYYKVSKIINTKKYHHINSANLLYVSSFLTDDIDFKIKLLKKAITLKKNPYFYIGLGDAFFIQKKIDESLKNYFNAFDKLPYEKELAIKISNCFFRLKKMNEHSEFLKKAMQKFTYYPPLYQHYAFLLLQMKEIDEAQKNMELYLSFAPFSLNSIYIGINFYDKLNNKFKIIELLKYAEEVNDNIIQYITFIKKCHEYSQYELGFRAYKEAIEKFGISKELEDAYMMK